MKQTVDTKFAGYQPVMNTFKYRNVGPATADFAAAVDVSEYNEAIFFDNSGNSIDKIPSTGEFTAVVYVETGYVYEPVLAVYVSDASADAFNTATGSESKDVVIVVASDDVPPTPTVSSDTVFPTGKNFTVNVGSGDKAALESVVGVSLDLLPASVTSRDQSYSTEEFSDGTYYLDEVALIPVLQNMAPNIGNHKYVVAFKYAREATGRTIAGAPVFYPDDVTTTTSRGTVYAIDYSTLRSARTAAASDTTTGSTGFLVFKVSGDVVATLSAANASFTEPRLLARTNTTISGDIPTYDRGTSSSSGGCSAGSAALALAVLGSFILTRKK